MGNEYDGKNKAIVKLSSRLDFEWLDGSAKRDRDVKSSTHRFFLQ